MPHLLLISQHAEIIDAFQSWVPNSYHLLAASSMAEIADTMPLDTQPTLVVFDATGLKEIAALCQSICLSFDRVPLIVLLDDLASRQAVLEAGAYDVLLTPLCQAELAARLSNCLHTQELAREQEELQSHAAQMAFVLLISRLLDDQFELPAILSQTLEQTASLTNASSAEIWLFSEENQPLELAAALRGAPAQRRFLRQPFCDPHLTEMILAKKRPLLLTAPQFQDELEDWDPGMNSGCLLAFTLSNRSLCPGLLLLYKRAPESFNPQDLMFAENIAPLIATAITNTQLMEKLRRYAERQRVLHEMSHQISPELDLNSTLHRAIQWMLRISGSEAGIVWLTDEREVNLEAVTVLGFESFPAHMSIPLEAGIPDQPSLFIHDLDTCEKNCQPYLDALQQPFNNINILPLRMRGRIVGAVTLFNRMGGVPRQEDTDFTITATEMIAISVSNSRMHTRLVQLMEEREKSHRAALKDERLVTIGRLTASIAHEINNPMQAIRGAIDLALEELNNPQELKEYLQLSLKESDRVIRLVSRMRQLYRPSNDRSETLNLRFVLQEALETGRQEFSRQSVTPRLLTQGEFHMTGILNQLHLIFLSVLLTLCDTIGRQGGGEILITIHDQSNLIGVEFVAPGVLINPQMMVNNSDAAAAGLQEETQLFSGLALPLDILNANQGRFVFHHTGSLAILRVELPKAQAGSPGLSDLKED